MNCIVSLIRLFVTYLLNVIDLHFFDTIGIVYQALGFMKCDIILGVGSLFREIDVLIGFFIGFCLVGMIG